MTHDTSIQLGKALAHPLRVRILMTLNTPPRVMSPNDFAEETGVALGNASYHFRQLTGFGCIELVNTKQRRGATEHFYAPVRRAMAWTREWDALGPVVKQNLAATALRGVVEAVGNAVDSGTFEARADSHLSYDTMRVDDRGWEEVTEVMNGALARLMEIGAECSERGASGSKLSSISFAMTAFEAPRPGEMDQ